ncbi:phage tail protein I [Pseudoflavonifractor sp. 524-17]|uniref:phage tail protein I n=1 Tax=Pseudoflavonifractor sp. 524-17 TaxID=2304577 RepID=UPI00137AB579|nr:phage tail protein I [Pseudoflavonifractor sp. 524-17]NCE63013.1 phage tail protein I [Pseudoflavonifractor sp. 524-17]
MDNYGITKENLLLLMPPALTHDKSIMALAEADAEALVARLAEIDRVRIISNIDALEDAVLDILARDFKVDWWDADYSVEEKRRTLKDSWRVHKTLGTKAAVETALSAIYPNAKVTEWFEYGGEPYRFRLQLDASHEDINSERHRRVLRRVDLYKSLRSHLDGIKYIIKPDRAVTAFVGAAAVGSYTRLGVSVQVNGRVDRPHIPLRGWAGVQGVGLYAKVHVPVNLHGTIARPHRTLPIHAGAALAGTYTKITMEVTVNGLG